MADVNINNGLSVVISKFASLDTKNKDGKLVKEELIAAKGLNAEGTEFLQKIIYNQSNLFELIESTVPNDGPGISLADLETIASNPNSNLTYILGETFDLETAILQTTQRANLSSPVHLRNNDGTLCPTPLLNLYAVALYKSGVFSKDDYNSAIQGILEKNITKIQNGIKKAQKDAKITDGNAGNIIGHKTMAALFQKIKDEDLAMFMLSQLELLKQINIK